MVLIKLDQVEMKCKFPIWEDNHGYQISNPVPKLERPEITFTDEAPLYIRRPSRFMPDDVDDS